MAKDMDMREHGDGCMCNSCGGTGAMWGHYHWGHLLVKVFIVMFIFWAGVQFGELKATIQNNFYGGSMMGGWGGNSFYLRGGQDFGPGMMTGWTTSAAPAAGAVNVQMMRISTSSRE